VDHLLKAVWADWRLGAAIAAAVAALLGIASALSMPRGPLTAADALTTMAVTFIVGLAAGFALRSRWAMILSPVMFIAVFELGRLDYEGPTVDGIHLGSFYGIAAFVLGRGFHGVLALAPMTLGVVYGVALARRLAYAPTAVARRWRPKTIAGWTATGVPTLALLALAFLIARPASTPAILGPDGEPLPGSIAEMTNVEIGGHDQAMLIRGHSEDNPVLLYLAGGPGGTDIGAHRIFWEDLERDFVVVTWDQRGAGKSYPALDPTSTLTLEQAMSDTIDVTNYLRERFDEDKVYLVGNSWGATLGVLAAQQRPELFHAYIGAGQMVSQTETDKMFYEDTLEWAEQTGNKGVADTLRKNGPPPYDDILNYIPTFAYERDWNDYERVPRYDAKGEMPSNLFVREYTLLEKIHAFAATMDTFSVLYPYLRDVDFREDAASLDVPVYMLLGQHEARGRAVLADEWFDMLDAPSKKRIVFELSGHRPHFEEPERFAEVMADIVSETSSEN
jgi:pimeloyl-ACP methyl ester carboxylesterase